jgi:hypothetical protein
MQQLQQAQVQERLTTERAHLQLLEQKRVVPEQV